MNAMSESVRSPLLGQVVVLVSEAALLTGAGIVGGVLAFYGALLVARPSIDSRFGLDIGMDVPSPSAIAMLLAIFASGVVAGLLPALKAYRLSLADGMMVRT